MFFNFPSIKQWLTKPISFFGIKLWVAILICIVLFVLVIALCIIITRRCRNALYASMKPTVTKELEAGARYPHHSPVVFDAIRPNYQFTLAEIEAATHHFADENVVSCGEYAVVYHGIMFGNTRVAVKRLLSSRVKENEFTGEVEALLGLRHKNLVKLLGYCSEGHYRIIVDESAENGHLGQWLHDCNSEVSPFTWNIRMNIVLGIAKGLAYLHEDTEPAITHQHLKSSSILLDKQWNPKISDFGITNLLGSHESPPTGMSVYLAPEYLSPGILDDKNDVYSFGIVIMEIVSGKTSIEYTTEEYLIDWTKSMVASQQYDKILDPKLPELPCLKELKRILLVALICVDPDVNNRPKMGKVIHMLQPLDLRYSSASS